MNILKSIFWLGKKLNLIRFWFELSFVIDYIDKSLEKKLRKRKATIAINFCFGKNCDFLFMLFVNKLNKNERMLIYHHSRSL